VGHFSKENDPLPVSAPGDSLVQYLQTQDMQAQDTQVEDMQVSELKTVNHQSRNVRLHKMQLVKVASRGRKTRRPLFFRVTSERVTLFRPLSRLLKAFKNLIVLLGLALWVTWLLLTRRKQLV